MIDEFFTLIFDEIPDGIEKWFRRRRRVVPAHKLEVVKKNAEKKIRKEQLKVLNNIVEAINEKIHKYAATREEVFHEVPKYALEDVKDIFESKGYHVKFSLMGRNYMGEEGADVTVSWGKTAAFEKNLDLEEKHPLV